jgi:branched-chain amino acid transport system substrate-binding protein
MKRSQALGTLAVATFIPRSVSAAALPPLRIGWVGSFSGGLFELAGKAADAAVAAFFKEHGDTVAGRKVEILKRDDGGVAPDTAKRLAQELVVNNQVDFLMGLTVSPNAMGVGLVSTQAKVPLFITNASALGILERNPYAARFSYTEAQLTYPLARWAAKNNIKSAYSIVLDLSPGIDAATSFEAAFTAGGGKALGQVRVPITANDYSPYIQRIRDAKPEAVFAFLTTFGHPFFQAWDATGGARSGIKVLATGDMTNESGGLQSIGEAGLGLYTSMNYSGSHSSALNRQVTRDMHAADPQFLTPDFYSVATYDALHAVYLVTAAQNGSVNADKTMELVKGLKFESPRGPIAIDPQTRDINQNVYIRRVDKVGGRLQNTEIAMEPMVRDPDEK